MDAIEMLKAEHKGAKSAIEEILRTPAAKIKPLFEALSKALEAHDRIEERIFYPAVKANPKASGFEALDKTAHLEVEAALVRLKSLSAGDKEWMPAFRTMQEKLMKHVADEETKYFVSVRAVFSVAELNVIGEKMRLGKEKLARVA